MIRKFQRQDLEAAVKIWLAANKEAHDFIDPCYWEGYKDAVKEMFLQAVRSQSIGKQLLDFVKQKRKRLELNVYVKNKRAVQFYKREGFCIQREGKDAETGEKEYCMLWIK